MKATQEHKQVLINTYNSCIKKLMNDLIIRRNALVDTVDEWKFKEQFLNNDFFKDTAKFVFLEDMKERHEHYDTTYNIMKEVNNLLTPDEEC